MIVKCRKNLGRQLRHRADAAALLANIAAYRAHFGEILVSNASQSLCRGAPWRKKRITRRPRATLATVATNASMFLVRSKKSRRSRKCRPAHRRRASSSGLTGVLRKKSCKYNAKRRSDAEQASRSCFFFLKTSPESQLSQGRSAQVKKRIQNMRQPSAAIGVNNRGGWRTKSPACSDNDQNHDPTVSRVPHPPESASFGISGSSVEIKGARRSCATVHTRSSRTSA